MKRVMLIGAGNIGTRHLQGLFGVREKCEVYVYDTSDLALSKCKEICDGSEVSKKHRLFYIANYEQVPQKIDLVIIATTSNVRRTLVEGVLAKFEIKYFILEKVLFQKVEDFYVIKKILEEKDIKAWVNCPMRIYPSYKKIKDEIAELSEFTVEVKGSNWGLCCNTIHFLDLISFLADDDDSLEIDKTKFDNKLIESKRQGFYELSGEIEGKVGKCVHFCIKENEDIENPIPRTISIKSDKFNCFILERDKKAFIFSKNTFWKVVEEEFDLPYQSQIAFVPVNDIFEKEKCGLPTYEQSMKEHLVFFEGLINQFEKFGIGEKKCPIT